jgi:hypothetical protein
MRIITMIRVSAGGRYYAFSMEGSLTTQEAHEAVVNVLEQIRTDRNAKVETLVFDVDEDDGERHTIQ